MTKYGKPQHVMCVLVSTPEYKFGSLCNSYRLVLFFNNHDNALQPRFFIGPVTLFDVVSLESLVQTKH